MLPPRGGVPRKSKARKLFPTDSSRKKEERKGYSDRTFWESYGLFYRNTTTRNLQVDMVIVPATTEQMGILPGHVATIAELKPGVVSIHEGNDIKKYFVSSGFAFVHANSIADIIAIEAVPVDQIDPIAVQKGLAEFTQKLSSASTDQENAEAQIEVDVLSALSSAVSA